ncbi:flocculation protein FLO11-like [Haliotis rufescens]|uniref:flocculation protein FLO11-like n=1 Tax=Haliotis rufescens TaxID=6454 RepID=UPI00201F0DE9|nr:flocculation protein FLO11-like [Haliotis rufescens]
MSPATVTQTDVPPTWTPLDRYQNCEKVELETSTDEFTTVMSSIYKTLSANRCIVKHVCRLQNALLWHNYQSMKKTLQMAHGTEIIDQRQLFHGTDTLDVVNNICINNFDFRVSGKNATVYGKGAYFARDAKYSHSYTKGRDRYMFLARVLAGKYTLGDSSYTRPPPRKGHVLYDSCVNDEKNPSIFVIFERNQCYPEYLVEYRDGAVDEPSSVKIQPVRARAPTVASSKVQIINQTSSVQPIQAAPSPTKTLAAASRGNVFLNQNQTTSTSNTVSSSSSSNNQRQVNPWMGYTNASSAHTQSSVEGGAVDEPSSVKIQPVRARAPTVASSKVQIINQTSSVQPIQAAPSPTKTLAAASRGNVFLNQNQTTSTSNTVSSSSSSNNQRQVNPWIGYTNASSAHTQSSVEDGAVDEPSSVKIQPVRARAPTVASSKVQIINQTSSVQPIQAAPSPTKILAAASVEGGAVDKARTSRRQSCAQSPYSPTKDTPALGQSILSQKTSTNEGLSSKNEHPQKEISSDSTMYTSTFKQSAASQKTSSNSGLSSWNNQHKIDNPRSSIKDTCAYGQSNAGLSSRQINDSDRMTKDLSAYGQSSISRKTNARVNSLNNQSQVYYKVFIHEIAASR